MNVILRLLSFSGVFVGLGEGIYTEGKRIRNRETL
jgi:hypothetical protein